MLHEELSTLVCEGQYAEGLTRILDTYLRNLGGASQPCAWVNGFYGSGSSHYSEDAHAPLGQYRAAGAGTTARNLVPSLAEGPVGEARAGHAGRRPGACTPACGNTPAGRLSWRSPRRSRHVPAVGWASGELRAQARFCLHFQRNGFYAPVEAKLREKGRDLARELNDLYVSPLLHDALVEVDPGFADRRAAREAIPRGNSFLSGTTSRPPSSSPCCASSGGRPDGSPCMLARPR